MDVRANRGKRVSIQGGRDLVVQHSILYPKYSEEMVHVTEGTTKSESQSPSKEVLEWDQKVLLWRFSTCRGIN